MKKLVAAFLTSMMVLSRAGCGKTDIAAAAQNEGNEDAPVEAYLLDDGTHEYDGRIGSTMKTCWFNFSVDDAYYTTDSIGGYEASDGNELVVVELTLKNTFEESVPMFDTDFELIWNVDDKEKMTSVYCIFDEVMDDQFPSEYDLEIDETRTGYLVFEAPKGTKDFAIGFLEQFESEEDGDIFLVYFTADKK